MQGALRENTTVSTSSLRYVDLRHQFRRGHGGRIVVGRQRFRHGCTGEYLWARTMRCCGPRLPRLLRHEAEGSRRQWTFLRDLSLSVRPLPALAWTGRVALSSFASQALAE